MEAAGGVCGRGGVGQKWGLTYGSKQKKACMSAHVSVEVVILSQGVTPMLHIGICLNSRLEEDSLLPVAQLPGTVSQALVMT